MTEAIFALVATVSIIGLWVSQFRLAKTLRDLALLQPTQKQPFPPVPLGGAMGHDEVWDSYIHYVEFPELNPCAVHKEIDIGADSDFLLEVVTFAAKDANGVAVLNPPLDLQIADVGSSRALFSNPVSGRNLSGLVWPAPRRFIARAKILATVVNRGPATLHDVTIAFCGRKIWNLKGGTGRK